MCLCICMHSHGREDVFRCKSRCCWGWRVEVQNDGRSKSWAASWNPVAFQNRGWHYIRGGGVKWRVNSNPALTFCILYVCILLCCMSHIFRNKGWESDGVVGATWRWIQILRSFPGATIHRTNDQAWTCKRRLQCYKVLYVYIYICMYMCIHIISRPWGAECSGSWTWIRSRISCQPYQLWCLQKLRRRKRKLLTKSEFRNPNLRLCKHQM